MLRDRDLQLHQGQPGLTPGLGQVGGGALIPHSDSRRGVQENRGFAAVPVTEAGPSSGRGGHCCFPWHLVLWGPLWAVPQ